MISQFETYLNEKAEYLESSGIQVKTNMAEIRPALFKLNVTMENISNVSNMTVWDKGENLLTEAEAISLNISTRQTIFLNL